VSGDPAPVGLACPVCQWPDQGSAGCGQCGARLRSGYVVGAPPPAAQDELDSSIAGARRRHALRVAVRAAGWRGRDSLARLARLADGGGPASDREIQDAVAAYDEQEAPRPAGTGVGFTLSRLVAGDTDAAVFVEISPEGIAVHALVADELGVPGPEPGGHVRWTDAMPGLPADDDLRTYLLAGGGGDPAALAASVAAVAEQEITRQLRTAAGRPRRGRRDMAAGQDPATAHPPLAGPDTVLVCRTRRWPSLDAAADRARAVLRPVAEIFAAGTDPLPVIVSEVARQAPLRYDYCLVVGSIDQRTGMVRPVPRPLFRAGTTGQQRVRPTVDTAVMAPSAPADRLILPVVARRGDDPAGWPAVGVAVMDGTVPGPTQLRVRLETPGRVSMSARPSLVEGGGPPGWPGVLAGLPARLPGAVAADVVLLAELGGEPDAVGHRMDLVDGVVSGLDSAGVKVAVVGYREHWDRYSADAQAAERRLVVGCGLGDPADVRALLARKDLWRAVEIRDRNAAPLEDALDWIADPDWVWRPAARHVLVVFASRPPHPGKVDARGEVRASTCWYGLSWQEVLGRLRDEQAVECLTVRSQREAATPAGDHAEQAWAEFGAVRSFSAEGSTAADLVRAIGIGPADEDARLPLAVAVPDV
jgi:hypothetical protein